jgi:hypothetical protein
VAVESGGPVADALVLLEPGGYRTRSDSAGTFHLQNLPRGRYQMRVLSIGRLSAQDSVTIGEHGLIVLAALTQPEADLAPCIRIAPRPPAT